MLITWTNGKVKSEWQESIYIKETHGSSPQIHAFAFALAHKENGLSLSVVFCPDGWNRLGKSYWSMTKYILVLDAMKSIQ